MSLRIGEDLLCIFSLSCSDQFIEAAEAFDPYLGLARYKVRDVLIILKRLAT